MQYIHANTLKAALSVAIDQINGPPPEDKEAAIKDTMVNEGAPAEDFSIVVSLADRLTLFGSVIRGDLDDAPRHLQSRRSASHG